MKQAPRYRPLCVAAVVSTLIFIAACSKEQPVPAPDTPLVEKRAADTPPASDEFRGSYALGGIAATYRAIFNDGKIQRLEETRTATSQVGTYEFLGARLVKYRGAALGSADDIELEFDQQGKLIAARAGDKAVDAAEITAIRNRAQSLRSHAVAMHDVQGHDSTKR
jgi:hypothetical protein